jgi:ornithine carbamoyltransferase
VAASLSQAVVMLGGTMRIGSPEGFALDPAIVEGVNERAPATGGALELTTNPSDAVRGADAVYTDVWTSMGQEKEATSRRRIFAPYQVNAGLMAQAAPNARFMHCLPAHRGDEVTDEVMDSKASVVFDQAENRLHAQKALLAMLCAK